MEKEFWLDKWHRNEIGFHNREVHPLLEKYWGELKLAEGSRVFLPLCGKTLDIAWLLEKGYRVAGAELSELAIQQLFQQLGIEPQVEQFGDLKRYRAQDLDIFVGDIFNLSIDLLGQVDGVYDRAALVALPEPMRERYTGHLMSLTARAPQLLITFDYDQSLMPGPPFSISDSEVAQHYGIDYRLVLAGCIDVPGGLKGKCQADEKVWILTPQKK